MLGNSSALVPGATLFSCLGSNVAESKVLPPASDCCSSSARYGPQDCLTLCPLKPKENG